MGLRISKVVADRLSGAADGLDPARPLSFEDLRAARRLAAALAPAERRELSAGRLKGAVELATVLRRKLEEYFESAPKRLERLLRLLSERASEAEVRAALELFREEFLASESTETDRAAAPTEPDLKPLLVEAILVWAIDSNPVAAPIARELQGEKIWSAPAWRRLIGELSNVLESVPPLDRRRRSLADSLRAPALEAPESLAGQFRYLLDEWSDLGEEERRSLIASLDLIAEEEAPRFPPGPGPIELPDYDDFGDESPRYSADLHWMEPLVLIAKNSYVWLDQLSRQYEREITRLDQIPDRELDRLAEWGVRGLWLIGVWQRSTASALIKRRLGNSEALASAYSLYDYAIADELGGAAGVEALAERASERGIRLAADMVPNHMGIDSKWLLEHPDRFLSVPECPFPAYTFDGPDLSPDPDVGVYLEDHYWDRTDAAVVFKRVDRRTGETRYVYHGNDGTSTPWNDTAQLDYLNPETRRAVMSEILRVAGSFPIIRFDAAMTLARRHVQRLWYPTPGGGGAIPSRSEHALSKDEFRRAMPTEFWREVVDLVAAERPDTLLLAEAFWLMESFFVRTLGMHRVYNSAFMNLLRDGETAKLRRMMRETLEFDPRILERYVNFLSNPDEQTAIEQFGSGDRYFGACVVLATLPGLPMIAHGQFEGYREKYGMEFRRPTLDERPDAGIVGRHRREIVPLLRRRDRFASAASFRLLDLRTESGGMNDRVLAYANGREIDRTIVVFNNSSERSRGTLVPIGGLFEPEPDSVYRFRDRTNGLYFLARSDRLAGTGLEVDLDPFESRVLLDFRPVLKTVQEPYQALADRLKGRGVRNLELELELLEWWPLLEALRELLGVDESALAAAVDKVERAAAGLRANLDTSVLASGLERLADCEALGARLGGLPWPDTERLLEARLRLIEALTPGGDAFELLRALTAMSAVRAALGGEPSAELGSRLIEELVRPGGGGRVEPGPDPVRVLAIALEEEWLDPGELPGPARWARRIRRWLRRPDANLLFGVNRYADEEWLRKEELELFLEWLALLSVCGSLWGEAERELRAPAWWESVDLLKRLFTAAGWAFGPVRDRLSGGVPAGDDGAGREADAKSRSGRGRKRSRSSRAR